MQRQRHLAHLFGGGETVAHCMARGRHALTRLRGDKRGGAAVLAAMSIVPLLGVSALAVDVGGMYLLRRNMQAAVDAGAMAGAANLDANPAATAEAVARGTAMRNLTVYRAGDATVTVASAMVAAPNNPDPVPQVTVTAQRSASSTLLGTALRAFGQNGPGAKLLSVTAVAQMLDSGAKNCVEARWGSVTVGNNVDITAPKCAIASASDDADAIRLGDNGKGQGSGTITASNIVSPGGCAGCTEKILDRKLVLTQSSAPSTNGRPLRDPYPELENYSPPPGALSSCKSHTKLSNQQPSVQLSPGCYNALDVNNGSINMAPGVYYVTGNIDVKGALTCSSCKANGPGVSLVMVGQGNSAPGTLTVTAQGSIDLNAGSQSSDPALDGVLIYRHDPKGQPAQGSHGEIDFHAGATVNLDGAVVAPTTHVTMGGNAATDPQGRSCNIFVVGTIDFSGGSSLSAAGCDMYGTKASVPRIPRLVQ